MAQTSAVGKPKLMQQLRQALRSRHYSQSTETLYCYWVRRYCRFHDLRHPQEMGEAEIKLSLVDYAGDALEIGFNPGYVLDALKVAGAETVTLEMKAPNKPGVLRAGDFTYVVMPVNLNP